jgi:lipoprotein NlpD
VTPASNVTVKDWGWPTNGKVIRGFKGSDRKGVDFGGSEGQAITAAAPGNVVYSGSGLRGYGQLIIIKHNKKFLSAYAHNKKLHVREGDKVVRGQRIADMGRTGTERVKLHFEIRKNGKPVDPFGYLPRNPGRR